MLPPRTDDADGDRLEGPFRIGEWTVEPALNRLRGGQRSIRLEPRVMDLLVCLASRAGTPISRQELHESVWSDAVVGDEALTMAISKLRRALGDNSQAPRLVETIAKGGYRLMVPVEPLRERSEADGSGRRHRRAWQLGLLACLLIVSIYFATASIRPDRPAPTVDTEPIQILRLTSQPGVESQAEVSPDGTRVVYVRHGSEEPEPGVYIMALDGGPALRLTEEPTPSSPVWSPDGRRIAFTSCRESGCELRIVGADGGPARTLAGIAPSPLTGIDWSPEGRWIALALATSDNATYAVFEIDVETGERRQLTEPDGGLFDARPTYSPDGRQIAFSRGKTVYSHDLFIISRNGGPARQLTREGRRIWGFDWLGDGRSLVFSSNRRGRFQLWRIPLAGGEPSWIPVSAEDIRFPSITGSYLTFDRHENLASIWQVVPGGRHRLHEVINSNRRDTEPRHAPDGRGVAFVSNRSDSTELWVTDGTHEPRRLSDLGATFMSRPEWSPDGRQLAVAAVVDAVESIYVVDVPSGTTRQIEEPRLEDRSRNPSWSADGRWIYFASDRTETWSLWRIPAGGGTATEVAAGGYFGLESVDGATLYWTRADQIGLWQQPVAGGSASLTIDDPALARSRAWILVGDAVYFPSSVDGDFKLLRRTLDGGESQEVVSLPATLATPIVSVSPVDGSVLYSAYLRSESDVNLVTSFH